MHPNGRNDTNFHHIASDFEINFVEKTWESKMNIKTSTEHNTVKQSGSDGKFFFLLSLQNRGLFYRTIVCVFCNCSGF